MAGEGGRTQFIVSGDDPFVELLHQVREAAQGVYDILGEMGRSTHGNVVYLARELESGHLVALKLTRSGTAEYALDVVRTLDTTVPGLESSCPQCRAVLPDWDRFCFRCGADLSATDAAASEGDSGALLAAVKEATADTYDILGHMARAEGGGTVFFARDKVRGKLVVLRLQREEGKEGEASYSIGETQLLRPMAAQFGQTQVIGAADRPTPPPRPAPSSAPPPPPAAPPPEQPGPPRARSTAPWLAALTRVPRKAWYAAGGAALVLLIAVVALSGDGSAVAPVTPDSLAAAVPPDSLEAAHPDTAIAPTAPAAVAVDSATIRLTVALPAGAVFTVDDAPMRSGTVRVAAGSHVLSVLMTGVPPVSQRVTLRADQEYRWAPRLAREATTPAPPPRPPAAPARATCARAFGRSDWVEAATLCLAEADEGSRDAQRMMGRMRELGNGVQQDVTQAASWYLKAAAAGDSEAQRRLGYFYRNGTGVRKNEEESARWFRMGAEQGDPISMLEYGVALEAGDGVRRDETAAGDWYRRAADGGSGAALRRLGRLYERGRGVQKNEAEAARYYEQAGGKGDAEAMYLLGRMYKDGRGVQKSEPSALEWFQKAAALGHREAAEEARKLERPD